MPDLKSPFPYFGGKSIVAPVIWKRFGKVQNFIDPFFGSGSMLFGRPLPFEGSETVNDMDGFVSNFFRALKADPVGLADVCDRPVNENDLHAIHASLVGERRSTVSKLEGDPEWYDLKIAGWWCWGLCCWIGGGWCSGEGPWKVVKGKDGFKQLVNIGSWDVVENADGTSQLVHLGNAGRGVNRQLVHLGNAGQGVNRKRVHLGDAGQGVNRQRVADGDGSEGLLAWFGALSDRLKRVRVCCGDWTRVCGGGDGDALNCLFVSGGTCAVFLDPPYADTANREANLYSHDSLSVAHDVREWALAHGDDKRLRICLCGYEGEHVMPESWECVEWKAQGGMGNQSSKENLNARRERLWFSPHCIRARKERGFFDLFDRADEIDPINQES